jgi:hypothetical protein
MSDTLRDTIAKAYGSVYGWQSLPESAHMVADAVLTTPEMQAIREVLRVLLELKSWVSEISWDPETWDALEVLPESVAAWALDGDK